MKDEVTISAIAIAYEFRLLRENVSWPQQMYIQKLVHIANGWNMAVNSAPLIDEDPRPGTTLVYRTLWDFIRMHGLGSIHSISVGSNLFARISLLKSETS